MNSRWRREMKVMLLRYKVNTKEIWYDLPGGRPSIPSGDFKHALRDAIRRTSQIERHQ